MSDIPDEIMTAARKKLAGFTRAQQVANVARALMAAAEAATKRADDAAIKLKLLLSAVLDDAERDLNSLIECCSTLEFDTDGNPRVVPGTLEEDVREEVAARQELYASARAAIKGEGAP